MIIAQEMQAPGWDGAGPWTRAMHHRRSAVECGDLLASGAKGASQIAAWTTQDYRQFRRILAAPQFSLVANGCREGLKFRLSGGRRLLKPQTKEA